MRATSSAVVLLGLMAALTTARRGEAQVVTYSGALGGNGAPIHNGFVIAGTFKPGFDPFSYNFVYGIDGFGNMETPMYAQAVSDGNFIPIGAGTLSNFGAFSGFGSASVGPGRQIWLFGFPQANPDSGTAAVLATHLGWTTDADLTITASDATIFKFGQKSGNALEPLGLPVPEPASALFAGSALVVTLQLRRRGSRLVQSFWS